MTFSGGYRPAAAQTLPWPTLAVSVLAGLAALLVAWIGALSLGWPVEGDATVFHFLAVQHALGSMPYRDIVDMNMPLIYWIHDALIGSAGLGDGAFRAFDLAATVLLAGLGVMFVWPAGRPAAVLAGLSLALMHLAFGPLDEGQRDFLLLIPELVATLCACAAAEVQATRWRGLLLFVAGLAVAAAALFKPTALLLGLVIVVADGRLRISTLLWAGLGFAVGMGATIGALAATGALEPFLHAMKTYLPAYGPVDHKSKLVLAGRTGVWVWKLSGFVAAGLLSLRAATDARIRVAIFLVFRPRSRLRPGEGLSLPFLPLDPWLDRLGQPSA